MGVRARPKTDARVSSPGVGLNHRRRGAHNVLSLWIANKTMETIARQNSRALGFRPNHPNEGGPQHPRPNAGGFLFCDVQMTSARTGDSFSTTSTVH